MSTHDEAPTYEELTKSVSTLVAALDKEFTKADTLCEEENGLDTLKSLVINFDTERLLIIRRPEPVMDKSDTVDAIHQWGDFVDKLTWFVREIQFGELNLCLNYPTIVPMVAAGLNSITIACQTRLLRFIAAHKKMVLKKRKQSREASDAAEAYWESQSKRHCTNGM